MLLCHSSHRQVPLWCWIQVPQVLFLSITDGKKWLHRKWIFSMDKSINLWLKSHAVIPYFCLSLILNPNTNTLLLNSSGNKTHVKLVDIPTTPDSRVIFLLKCFLIQFQSKMTKGWCLQWSWKTQIAKASKYAPNLKAFNMSSLIHQRIHVILHHWQTCILPGIPQQP